jgi:hypothetical protein
MAETLEDYLARQQEEWSQYVATGPVIYDGVVAATAGHSIPASHPALKTWLDAGLVVSTRTKVGKTAIEKGE